MSGQHYPEDVRSFMREIDEFARNCYAQGYYDGENGEPYLTSTFSDFECDLPPFHALTTVTWAKILYALMAARGIPIVGEALEAVHHDLANVGCV